MQKVKCHQMKTQRERQFQWLLSAKKSTTALLQHALLQGRQRHVAGFGKRPVKFGFTRDAVVYMCPTERDKLVVCISGKRKACLSHKHTTKKPELKTRSVFQAEPNSVSSPKYIKDTPLGQKP